MNYYDMYDQYDYSSPYMETTLIGIVMICLIVLLVCAIFGLISYILRGIGMYTMAKRQGMDYAWLAFIPFARTYLHGELAGNIRLKQKSIHNPGIWLLALPFLYSAVSSLLSGILWFVGFGSMTKVFQYAYLPYGRMDISAGSILGMLILFMIYCVISVGYTAVYKSFEVLVNHQILERFTSKNMSIAHAVLCTLVPMYESICFFVMRNHPFNPGMEPPAPVPFMQSPPPGSYYGTPAPPPEQPVPPMGGSYGDSTAIPPVQGRDDTGNSTYGFENAGNTYGTPDLKTSGNILEPSDSMNSGSILQSSDSMNPGSILQSSDSMNSGSILQSFSSENPENTSAARNEESEKSETDRTDSQVNFILPESENKES